MLTLTSAMPKPLSTSSSEVQDCRGGSSFGTISGNTYFHLGNYPKAIDYKQQRVALMREIKDRQGEKTALRDLVNAYSRLGDYAKATEYVAAIVGDRPRN